jgi:hypothetical protein
VPAASSSPGPYWVSADSVFDRLEGAWNLDRTIESQATMIGVAVFKRHDTGVLRYREEGRILMADGKAFDGHRQYRFERTPEGFTVFFEEEPPRLFHRIKIARHGHVLAGSATHLCAPDIYESTYRFLVDGTFVIRHTVRGPRKDYVSATVFSRREAQYPRLAASIAFEPPARHAPLHGLHDHRADAALD